MAVDLWNICRECTGSGFQMEDDGYVWVLCEECGGKGYTVTNPDQLYLDPDDNDEEFSEWYTALDDLFEDDEDDFEDGSFEDEFADEPEPEPELNVEEVLSALIDCSMVVEPDPESPVEVLFPVLESEPKPEPDPVPPAPVLDGAVAFVEAFLINLYCNTIGRFCK